MPRAPQQAQGEVPLSCHAVAKVPRPCGTAQYIRVITDSGAAAGFGWALALEAGARRYDAQSRLTTLYVTRDMIDPR